MPRKDLTGQKFGTLTVLERSYYNEKGHTTYWKVRCDCGNEFDSAGNNLIKVKFGCKKCADANISGDKSRFYKHGHHINGKPSPMYKAWQHMKERCYLSSAGRYLEYGGRGITVCERWLESFENFLEDMGPSWEPGLSLERKDVDGNYNTENCNWIPLKRQARNKQNTRYVEYEGQIWNLMDLLECHGFPGLKHNTVHSRLNNDWSVEDAIKTPPQTQTKRKVTSRILKGR